MVFLWLLLYLWLPVIFLACLLFIAGLELRPLHAWDNLIPTYCTKHNSSLHTPCIFQAHTHTWEEGSSAFLHDWNIFWKEEPFNQWNKACWLKNISHALFLVVLPTSIKLNIYRSEHFHPLLESCSQKCLFKWSSVNSLGSFMSCFAGLHISPREISPVSLKGAQPKHHSKEHLLCFPSVSSKMYAWIQLLSPGYTSWQSSYWSSSMYAHNKHVNTSHS